MLLVLGLVVMRCWYVLLQRVALIPLLLPGVLAPLVVAVGATAGGGPDAAADGLSLLMAMWMLGPPLMDF